MRVLITGHEGYIGAVMVPRLLEQGYDVVGFDTGFFNRCSFGDDSALRRVETIRADLRDVEAHHLEGFEAVLHLGALSNDPLGDLDAGLTHDINETASLHLARLAKKAGVRRFLFSSSCSTYGAAEGADFLDESAEFNPVTPYGISKVKVEEGLRELADDDFSPVYLRNATAYGYSPRLRLDIVLNNLVGWAHTTGRIVLMSDGTPWRPMVHVEDICRAFEASLTASRETVHDEAFNIGRTSDNYRIRELAEIVAETVPGCTVELAEGAGPDKRTYRVSCKKAEERLPGFDPQWDARRGAQQLYDAYRQWDMNVERFEGPDYKRLSTIHQWLESGRLGTDLRWV